MVRVFTHGKMEEFMKENIKMIKNMGTAPTLGQMVESTKVNG